MASIAGKGNRKGIDSRFKRRKIISKLLGGGAGGGVREREPLPPAPVGGQEQQQEDSRANAHKAAALPGKGQQGGEKGGCGNSALKVDFCELVHR